MGQTPPPWHGQAVATQILFEHEWPGFQVHRLRMEYSEEMDVVGRFQWRKLKHLWNLIREARRVLKSNPGCILFYPPASAKWVPFLRDVIFLNAVRHLTGGTVFIFHASGLPVFAERNVIAKLLSRRAYHGAEVSLEVAIEQVPPNRVFRAKKSSWCPCAIAIKETERGMRHDGRYVALFLASLQEGKGVLEILKTAKALKDRGHSGDFHFRIVGKWFSQEFEREAREMHAALELEGIVDFVGQLTGDAKWQAYADADVFFFPTHYASEATPIVIMEALGMGLPILSTEWAGIPAMLEGCQTATLLAVRSPEAYAEALVRMSAARMDGAKTREASRSFYRDHFLPERFIGRVAEAFHYTACSGGVSPSLDTHAREKPATVIDRSNSADDSTVVPRITDHGSLGTRLPISVYLADQNPKHDRSFGISRMSQVVLAALQKSGKVAIHTITARNSQQAPEGIERTQVLPWSTRGKRLRFLTDHLHPLFGCNRAESAIHYYPKGYLPLLSACCRPSVVTIHDTIIQHDNDHYPEWRKPWEYAYWNMMLKHTLRRADRVLTVSESARGQIEDFMSRHRIPKREITVTYEPCLYEDLPQPVAPAKENYVIHLASCEPHKRTAHLVRWWHRAEIEETGLPMLHLIGTVPAEVYPLLADSHSIVKSPFLEDHALQDAYRRARALVLPSEIEGFGLPALEAYYLGTPVCFVKGTSVEEVLSVATHKGGFHLDDASSLHTALGEVMDMTPEEIHTCGMVLRETYAADKVAARMMEVFQEVAPRNR